MKFIGGRDVLRYIKTLFSAVLSFSCDSSFVESIDEFVKFSIIEFLYGARIIKHKRIININYK